MSNDGTMGGRLMETLSDVRSVDGAKEQLERDMNQMSVYDEDPLEKNTQITSIPIPETNFDKQQTSNIAETSDSNIQVDADRARDMTYAMQDLTAELLGGAVKMACETQNPRAYGMVNDMMNTMRGLNKDLLENAKTVQDLTRGGGSVGKGSTTVTVEEDGQVTVEKTAPTTSNLLDMVEEHRRNNNGSSEGAGDIIDVEAE